jgi:uncharacterized protein (TIGR00725 family)
MASTRLKIVGVMGGHGFSADPGRAAGQKELARELGQLIGRSGWHLLTGGGPGAMEAVSEAFAGTPDRRGLVIGIIPGAVNAAAGAFAPKRGYPNKYVEVPIITHLNKVGTDGLLRGSRNHINVLTADVLVILEGKEGTLSEAMLARRYQKPAIAFLRDISLMPELVALGIERTDDLAIVQTFLERAPIRCPDYSTRLSDLEVPIGYSAPDF